ncbi:MAG: TatD family hydrolase, partial [bacterium]|nr:TatD family hydrolase [bacterium]
GVAHSFTGSIEEAQKYLDLGFYLGLNGIITFTKEYDEMIKNIPLDRILIETDAPWLTPAPNRGKRNEPLGVFQVAQKIAELRNESLEKIIEQTNQNCKELFGI